MLVLQTPLDVQRVREDDRLPVRDALARVEIAHHLDELERVPRVLPDAREGLGVGARRSHVGHVEARGVVAGRVGGVDDGLRCGEGGTRRGRQLRGGDGVRFGLGHRGQGLLERFEEDGRAEGVGQRYAQDAFAETADPVSQRGLVCVLVVIGDGRYAHEPLVGDGADGRDTVFHGEMDVACPTHLALPSSLRGGAGRPRQSPHHYVLSAVVPPSSCAKLREHAAPFHQSDPFAVRLFFLPFVTPVSVTEAKVRLACERKERDLVEYRV